MQAGRVENVLAAGRVILAVTAALIAYSGPSGLSVADHVWSIGYVIFSLIIVFVRPEGGLHGVLPVFIQVVDVAWIAILGRIGGPVSPSLALFTFALVTAAYRWGAWQTIGNGVVVAILDALVVAPSDGFDWGSATILFARSGYLIAMSVVLAYLFKNERRLRGENAIIARAVSRAKAEFGLTASAVGVLGEMRSFYDAESIVFAADELTSGVTYLLELAPGEPPSGRFVRIDAVERSKYLFPVDADCWYSTCKNGQVTGSRCLDAQGKLKVPGEAHYPQPLLTQIPFRAVLGVRVEFGQELVGRVLIFDPRLSVDPLRELAFLQRFNRSVMSAVYNVYLWRRLRERAGAIERARVARDLHDGLIQSLIGLEMRLETLKNQAAAGSAARAADIEPLQQLLRDEIRRVRDMMHQLREPGVEPSELVSVMSKQVDKFAQETGILAKFVAETRDVALPADVCREIVQILQEALTNVRKHSGAKELLVRLSSPESGLHLAIIDNGKGFGFRGRLTHAELHAQKQGPRVIKERVQLIHGELEIESVPGHGARLDVRLPKRTYA